LSKVDRVIDALIERIGLRSLPPADVDGLFTLHRAYLEAVPYEDIAVQLGETGPLDFPQLAARVIGGRGGYCFELNTVLAGLLRACGFVVTHHEAVVGGEGPVNHMALLVHLDGALWLADAGLGEGFLDPLPFREGTYEIGPFSYGLTDEGDGHWWMSHHEWGSFPGFRMSLGPSVVSDFEPHHRRLATSPESSFVKTLVVQKPQADRITTLRSRTLSSIGPNVDTKHVVADIDEFTATLRDVFGIAVAGERRDRLWAAALVQHQQFLARETV
jgi:N-hydroxyarylamine O-acetyltransferase